MIQAIKISSAIERKARTELAAAYHLAAKFEWTDLIYTHISVRVADGFLINPFGLNFNEVTPENLILVDHEGNILSETSYGINPAGLVVHSAVHQARQDLNAVVHLHTNAGMAISALQDGLMPLTQHACHFYNRIAYHDFEGIAMREEEMETITRDLGDKNVMILRNHGFLTAGRSIAEAFTLMYTLEKAAQAQISILSMGCPVVTIPHHICQRVVEQTGTKSIKDIDMEWQALLRLIN